MGYPQIPFLGRGKSLEPPQGGLSFSIPKPRERGHFTAKRKKVHFTWKRKEEERVFLRSLIESLRGKGVNNESNDISQPQCMDEQSAVLVNLSTGPNE